MKLTIVGNIAKLEREEFTICIVGDVHKIDYISETPDETLTQYAEKLVPQIKHIMFIGSL